MKLSIEALFVGARAVVLQVSTPIARLFPPFYNLNFARLLRIMGPLLPNARFVGFTA